MCSEDAAAEPQITYWGNDLALLLLHGAAAQNFIPETEARSLRGCLQLLQAPLPRRERFPLPCKIMRGYKLKPIAARSLLRGRRHRLILRFHDKFKYAGGRRGAARMRKQKQDVLTRELPNEY